MAKKNPSENKASTFDESRLQELFLSGNLQKVIDFFKDMPEEERKVYAPFCQRWNKNLWEYAAEHNLRKDEELIRKASTINHKWGAYNLLDTISSVAVLASCDIASIRTEARGNRILFYENTHHFGLAIRNRHQKMIQDIIEIAFGPGSIVGKDYWFLYRSFVQEGILEQEYSDFTVRMMFESMVMDSTAYPSCSQKSVSEQLESNPDLLQDAVWKIFEAQDFPAKWSYTDIDGQHGWKNAIVELIQKGRIDKQKVIDSCLQAISRPWTDHRLRWFVQLLERIPLEKNELQGVQPGFLDLLHHAQPTPRALGLTILERSFKEGTISDEDVINYLPILFREPSKAKVKKGIVMMEKIAKRSPALLPSLLPTAVDGLFHEQTDIQKLVAKFILQNKGSLDSSLREKINEERNRMTASVKEILSPLLAASGAKTKPTETPRNTASSFSKPDSIPEPTVPIADLEELIDAVLHFLAKEGRVEEMERIIDGIVRFHEERGNDFEKRTDVIRKKHYDFPACLFEMLVFWLLRRERKPDGKIVFDFNDELFGHFSQKLKNRNCSAPIDYIILRSIELITELCQQGTTRTLLSSPTHKGCLIDPIILIGRLETLVNPFPKHKTTDLLLSLLRLGKWNQEEAVRKLKQKNPGKDLKEYYDALRYALGDDSIEIGSDPALWAAASRSRDPRVVDHRLLEKHPQLGYGTARPPEGKELIEFMAKGTEYPFFAGFATTWKKRAQLPTPPTDYPTSLLYQRNLSDSDTPLLSGIFLSIWPNNPSLFYHKSAAMMLSRSNQNSYVENGIYPFEVLLDRSEPLHEEGALLLAAGLVQSQANVSGIATDAMIRAISQDRLAIGDFANGCEEILKFIQLAKTDEQIAYFAPKASRWAKPFKTVSQESSKHGAFVREILDAILPSLPERDLGPYLELFYELSIETAKKEFSARTSDLLNSFSGSGKSAKLAKKLLEL